MPIGSAKIGVLGAGLVPGGSQTFNASGTFTVPPGVKKVNITGKGGTGNPGNAGNSGNAGNPGTGGGAGAGGSFFQNQVKTYNLGGTGGFALKAVFPNGLFGTNTPNQCFSFLQNQPASCWPNKVPTAILQQTAYGSGRVTCTPNTPVNGSYGPRNVCAQPGSSGNAGTAGNAGNPGNAGNSSSGICKTFPGGAGGNAGAGGAAGNGGSGGNAGGNGGHWDQRNPGSAGNSAGAGGAGLSATFPATRRGYAGGGGGGAGITTAGASGRNSTGCPTSVCFSCLLRYARGGDSCMSAPLGPPTYLPGFNNQAFPNPPNAAPTNMVGGLGGAGNASNGLTAIAQNTGQLSIFNVNMACGNRINCGSFNPTPLRPQLFRAGGGGGGGGTGFQTGPGSCVINTGAGGGGGGRGLVGNCGGVSPTPSGSAATPQTFNCVSVTPGSSYPITVASPGGQIVISWNPQ